MDKLLFQVSDPCMTVGVYADDSLENLRVDANGNKRELRGMVSGPATLSRLLDWLFLAVDLEGLLEGSYTDIYPGVDGMTAILVQLARRLEGEK